MTAPSHRDPSAPGLLAERTWRDQAAQEFAHRKRQALALCRFAVGRSRQPSPLLVFTTSRSGSTWLCELLFGINQCGPLPEHLRPQHFEHALRSDDGPGQLKQWLEEAAALIRSGRDGGSKLIWDYFPDLFPDLVPDLVHDGDGAACAAMLGPLLDLAPACLRLRRRDGIAQAISRYRSSRTGVYHRHRRPGRLPRPAQPRAAAELAAPLAYDATAIAHHEDILTRAEAHLDAFIATRGLAVIEVVYEDLVANPQDVLLPIAARLRPDLDAGGQRRRVQRALERALIMKGEGAEQDEWRQRFLAERAS